MNRGSDLAKVNGNSVCDCAVGYISRAFWLSLSEVLSNDLALFAQIKLFYVQFHFRFWCQTSVLLILFNLLQFLLISKITSSNLKYSSGSSLVLLSHFWTSVLVVKLTFYSLYNTFRHPSLFSVFN